ncbi:MAG: glycosyltransferase family A protein [Parvibaculum sp.]
MTALWSIVIPTFHRPALLRQAVRSCMAARRPDGAALEIVVVDNSATGDAAEVCREMGFGEIRYVHEARPGLAHARNRGIDEARGEVLVFLDDDEHADENWLVELDRAFEASGADILCGWIEPDFAVAPERMAAYLTNFYRRDVERPSGADLSDILNYVGSGNSAFRRERCFGGGIRVDERFNHFGSEDIQLFRTLVAAGLRIAWAPKAVVHECIPVERASVPYLKARRRLQGQQRVFGMAIGGPLQKAKVPVFMAGGAAQAGLHAVLWLCSIVSGRRERATEHAIEIEGGLGKVFWTGASRRRIYGKSPD